MLLTYHTKNIFSGRLILVLKFFIQFYNLQHKDALNRNSGLKHLNSSQ
jgi:hypothetical protein